MKLKRHIDINKRFLQLVERFLHFIENIASVKNIAIIQSVLLLLLMYFTNPCKIDFFQECCKTGIEEPKNNIELVGVRNVILLLYGFVALYLFYSKYSNKNVTRLKLEELHTNFTVNLIFATYLWLIISVYILNPIQMSLMQNSSIIESSSTYTNFLIFLKMCFRSLIYLLALPISIQQSYQNYKNFGEEKFKIAYHIQTNVYIIAMLIIMQCLFISKLYHEVKQKEKEEAVQKSVAIPVNIDLKELQSTKENDTTNAAKDIIATLNQKNDILEKRKNPIRIDGSLKSKTVKPINITKPMSITTSPKILRKSYKLEISTQTQVFPDTSKKISLSTQTSFPTAMTKKVSSFHKENLTVKRASKTPNKSVIVSSDQKQKSTNGSQKSLVTKSTQVIITTLEKHVQVETSSKVNKKKMLSLKNQEAINIQGSIKEFKNVAIETVFKKTENKGMQADNLPTSVFTYDKGVQCSILKPGDQTRSTRSSFYYRISNIDKCVETKIDKRNKYVQTDLPSMLFREDSINNNSRDSLQTIRQSVQSITELSFEKTKLAEPVIFEASRCYDNLWYISLRSDVFLSLSYDMLKYRDIMKENINEKISLDTPDDILTVMKVYLENFRKLSTCFDVDEESDDESFINGFRL